MNKANIKNFFFDLDGTLLNSQKVISQQNIDSINKLNKESKNVFIATGRPYYFAKQEAFLTQTKFPIIACNGAIIYDFQKDEIVYQNPIVKEAAKEVFDSLQQNNTTFLVYTTKQIFGFTRANYNPEWFEWLESSINQRESQFRFGFDWKDLNNFDINKHDVIKFLVIKSDSLEQDIENARKSLLEIKNIYLLTSQTRVIDIMPVGSSKGNGIKILSEKFNLNLDESISFGDEDNDVSMFETTKYSVAMGQSKDSIKQKATFTTTSNNESGVSHFLEKHLK
ncbi:HAD family hydrolase [Mycoplasma procyoni]|uniref:HAD family hydrolase n=1 Tax=Mycoplasma procyoni TaxID=568784 RepID=UPI00197C585C|nr:HAD family hydrolase [Mycoplasma procyoni]MBN3534480.1 HAD family hydrolase [Mycoplasma procyoni]